MNNIVTSSTNLDGEAQGATLECATRPSRLPKFTRTRKDFQFQDALDDFRRDKMALLYGLDALDDLDAGMIMGDDELVRIADCARCYKIQSVEDLGRKIPIWDGVDEFGEEIVVLIQRYVPSFPYVIVL